MRNAARRDGSAAESKDNIDQPTKEAPSKQVTTPYSLADIRALAKVLNEYDLSGLELEQGGERIHLTRQRNGVAPPQQYAPVPAPGAVPATPVPRSEPAATENADDGSVLVTSPFVGTFYRAPSPEAKPFVEAGKAVGKGQVLCIVEAMKLMNEIETEDECKIVEILVQDGQVVEYGQALFRVVLLG